jgi:predicted DNA-binding transcriptional regulator AlpA
MLERKSIAPTSSPATTLDLVDIDEGCRVAGGDAKPISRATFYRHVKSGRFPPPVKVTPGISRWQREKLIAAVLRGRS